MKLKLLLSLLFFFSQIAHAGTVLRVSKKKSRVTINEIEDGDGIEKGARICIYKENGKKAACGKIRRIKNEKAYMKISKKRIRRIKTGMNVRSPDSPAPDGSSQGSDTNMASGASSMRFAGFWAGSIITPYSFQKLTYAVPETSNPDTIWNQEGAIKQQLFGLGLSAGFSVGPGMLITGFRYRASDDIAIDSDYSATNRDIYSTIKESASSTGIFFDYAYLTMPMGIFTTDLTAGLDIDMSSVKVNATVINESGDSDDQDLAIAESKLTLASLRLGVNFDAMFLDSFGMNFGLNILVPLAAASSAFSGEVTDSQASGSDSDALGEDLKTQLAHQKSSFGAEIVVGVVTRL